MTLILETILSILIIALIYCVYQLFRNQKVYEIRIHFLYNDFSRYIKYSYDEMFDPNKSNWYGLKWPRKKDFK